MIENMEKMLPGLRVLVQAEEQVRDRLNNVQSVEPKPEVVLHMKPPTYPVCREQKPYFVR